MSRSHPAARCRRLAAALVLCGACDSGGASAELAVDELLAPVGACANDSDAAQPEPLQEEAVRCLVDHARQAAGLGPLAASGMLHDSAAAKARDIAQCGDLSHTACDRDTGHWIAQHGYLACRSYTYAENLGFGTGPLGAPREVVRGWLESAGHRRNILTGDFRDAGAAVLRVERFTDGSGSYDEAAIWVLHLGAHEGC